MTNIISFIPDWMLFLIIAVICFIIYYYLPDEIKEPIKKFGKEYGFYVVLLLAWLYFRDKWGLVSDHAWISEMKYASFLIGFVLILYFATKSWLYEQRYYTNQLICDNISGSVHRFQELGNIGNKNNWVVFFLGTSGSSDERFVIPWPWAKKLVIVPKVSCQFIGNQIFVKTQVAKVDILELPEEVAHFVENDTFGKWCKDELYLGYWSIDIKATDPKYEELEALTKKKDSRINELKAMLEGKLTSTKRFISDTLAMQDKLKGKTLFRRPEQGGNQDE